MIKTETLKKIITSTKTLSQDELEPYSAQAQKRNLELEQYLINQKILSEEQLYRLAAVFYNLPFVNLENKNIRKDILFLVPEPIAWHYKIIAFDKNTDELKIALTEFSDPDIIKFLAKKTRLKIKLYTTTPTQLDKILNNYYQQNQLEKKTTTVFSTTNGDLTELKNTTANSSATKLVETILDFAILENASTIHIEPAEKELNIRYRIDGSLKNILKLPRSFQSEIIAQIKTLADLKFDQSRLPQDGSFEINTLAGKKTFRASIVPTSDGEKIVLNLLNTKNNLIHLEQLGFLPKQLATLKTILSQLNGLILVTGPLDCGKTTTLYSLLSYLNQPEVNIVTIENQIESVLAGINQSQINQKINYTFVTGLRSYLNQDPDIIMISELPDRETVNLAIHAALNNHLVLSTVPANNALSALDGLKTIGASEFTISSACKLIIAQRLVKKICPYCSESYALAKEEVKNLEKQINLKKILETLKREKILTTDQSADSLIFYRGKGCSQCNNQGHSGKTAIYEVLEINQTIADLIAAGAVSTEIQATAENNGMISLLAAAFIKAKTGITTIEEVLKITK